MSFGSTTKDCKYAMKEQTTWGTAEADASTVIQLDIDSMSLPDCVAERKVGGSNGTRFEVLGDYIYDQKGFAPEFTIKGIFKTDEAALLFAGIFQNVTETHTGTCLKTFTWAATQPDFSGGSSAGYTLTFFEVHPTVANSLKVKDCILKQLKLTMEPGKEIMYEATLVGRGAPAAFAAGSATFTRSSTSRANQYRYFNELGGSSGRFSIDFGAGAVNPILQKAEITFKQEVLAHGAADSEYAHFTILSKTGEFNVQIAYDSNYATARTNMRAGTSNTFRFGWGNATPGGTDADLDIVFTGQIQEATPDKPENGIIGVNLKGKMVGANTSTSPATVKVADSVNKAW